MALGQAEDNCLARAREALLDGNSAQISREGMRRYFGFSEEDLLKLASALSLAAPQEDRNLFPDFVAEDGSIIEHFRVSSSKTTGKGQRQRIEKAAVDSRFPEEFERVKAEASQNMGQVATGGTLFRYPKHSHENLLASLEKETSNHVGKLRKYREIKDVAATVFLLDYDELALSMIEDSVTERMQDRLFGDLLKQERLGEYRLSRDKEALAWLKGYSEEIDYVVMVTPKTVEAICLSAIDGIMHLLPYDYRIMSNVTTMERHFVASIAVPWSSNEES